jgi:hypothetical protein
MPFGFGHQDPNTPHTGLDNPWIGRGLMAINPLLGIGYRLWRGIHNHNRPPTYGAPGWGMGSPGNGYSNGQFGNPYGGFGGDYGLTGSGYGSTSGLSYGSGQGFGNGLAQLPGGTDQFGLPTGPVNLNQGSGATQSGSGSNGLGQLGQTPSPTYGSNPLIGMGFVDLPTQSDWQARALPMQR